MVEFLDGLTVSEMNLMEGLVQPVMILRTNAVDSLWVMVPLMNCQPTEQVQPLWE